MGMVRRFENSSRRLGIEVVRDTRRTGRNEIDSRSGEASILTFRRPPLKKYADAIVLSHG